MASFVFGFFIFCAFLCIIVLGVMGAIRVFKFVMRHPLILVILIGVMIYMTLNK